MASMQHVSHKHPTRAFITAVALAAAIGAGPPAAALAAQGGQAVVAHAAYLKTSARLGWNNLITLVPAGTDMSILSGGNAYWLHVRLPDGKTGYITADRYYVQVQPTTAALRSAPSTVRQATPSAAGGAIVQRAAYLKTSPQLGWNNLISLVPAGTQMQLLSGGNAYWLHVRLPNGKSGYITGNQTYVKVTAKTPATPQSASPSASQATSGAGSQSSVPSGASLSPAPSNGFSLPPGVHLDPSITPAAGTSASPQAKFQAVLQIAQSKLGTPYIWGHNEDRGQYGFDCSNYVEYVFHHALGYLFSTSSAVQFHSVGWPVALNAIQPGDLLFFSNTTNPTGSAHVGIYIGNGRMIQEGGGLGKAGYLSITTGFWSHHLVAARRMF